MIGVYYPYLASASRWEELRYSLRSLELFFREEYEVWIVGDLPKWIQNVKHTPHQKTEMTNAGATYDAVSKLKLYIDHNDSPDLFLRMYDDVYLTGARTVKQMQITRYLFTNEELNNGEFASGGILWRDQVFRSTDAMVRLGYPGYMTETHCPEVFEKDFSYGPGECELVETRLNRVPSICKGKYYLNHNDDGLDDCLKKFIKGMYPDKCRFER